MKIPFYQLAQQLKKQLLPLYLVSGDEHLLVQEAVTTIVEHGKTLGYTEHLRFTQDASFNWEHLLFAAKHLSLFDDQRILELKLTNFKIGNGERILADYVSNPPLNNLLLIVAPKLDSSAQKSKWFKFIENKAGIVQIWSLDLKQLPTWLNNRLKTNKLIVDFEGINFLIDYTQGNLLALNQEIEKLSLTYGKGKLSLDQIIDAITDNSRFNVFDLLDQALAGTSKNVVRIIHNLKQEGLESAIILWAVAKELRTLLSCHEAEDLEQAMLKLNIWNKRQPLIKQALQRHDAKNLKQMLKQAAQIDLYIKGAKQGNVWNELTGLYLALAGETILTY